MPLKIKYHISAKEQLKLARIELAKVYLILAIFIIPAIVCGHKSIQTEVHENVK